MDLESGRTALRCNVVPTVHSFIQATRIGTALLCVEEAGLLKVAAVGASPHSDLQLQARTYLPWARIGAALLALGMTS
jgi:hypothetical protein